MVMKALEERFGVDGAEERSDGGVPGVEILLPYMYSRGYRQGRLSLSRLVELVSTAPAKFFGVESRKGRLEVGLDESAGDPEERRLARSRQTGDDHQLVARQGQVDVFDTKKMEKQETHDVSQNPIYAIEFSPDNSAIAIGDEEGVVQMGDVIGSDLFLTSSLASQRSRINKIKFSPDGKLMATASLDGTVQMWVIERMDKMLPVAFKDHDDYVWSIEFSPSSDYLLAGTKDGILKLWPTKPELMAKDLCQYLIRNMTRKEWDRYVGEDIEYVNTCEEAGVSLEE